MGHAHSVEARDFRLRHIHPTSVRASEGATQTFLGKTYGFTEVPISHIPTSHDFVEGTYTHRMNDAGEFSLTFPNVMGSKGLWRSFFSADGQNEFVEIYRGNSLEFVGCIERVEIDLGRVIISGSDGWGRLKRNFEQDATITMAPSDVIRAYSRTKVAVVATDFSSLTGWNNIGGTAATATEGGLYLTIGTADSMTISPGYAQTTDDEWIATTVITSLDVPSTTTNEDLYFQFGVYGQTTGGTTSPYPLGALTYNFGYGSASGRQYAYASFQTFLSGSSYVLNGKNYENNYLPLPATFQIRKDRRHIYGYINGTLIGVMPTELTYLKVLPYYAINSGALPQGAKVSHCTIVAPMPYLGAGTVKGDYVLPTDQPNGYLRGRYWNDADMQGKSTTERWGTRFNSNRQYYGERADSNIDTGSGTPLLSLPLMPGGPGTTTGWFSGRWFGSVYLRPDLGDTVFQVGGVTGGIRLWVGKTKFEDYIINNWPGSGIGWSQSGTVLSSSIGTVAGWYPLILEYHIDAGTAAFNLQMKASTTYLDLGGAAVGTAFATLPKTSISPLGCYDNRIQGQSYFDITQGVGEQFGYQLWCEPKQFESGEFPGRLVPRMRVGNDTDVLLEYDWHDRVEPVIDPGVTIDASDQANNLIGQGAGASDGKSGQAYYELPDPTAMANNLSVLESWVDASDISYQDLLEARLNAELALRNTPWEELRGNPLAEDRLADSWPLTGTALQMRWRPGDGIRFNLPEIGVQDTSCRQITQISRTFGAEGRTGSQVSFRQRPRNAAASIRRLFKANSAGTRTYQGDLIMSSNGFEALGLTAGGYSGYIIYPLMPGDIIVKAICRILLNTNSQSVSLYLWGTDDVSSSLGGPWSYAPAVVDITSIVTQHSPTDNRLYWQWKNNGGSNTDFQFETVIYKRVKAL